jgi:putative ABC transport system permease protein
MFTYYVGSAWRGLRRSPILTALMVVAIGLGIGGSMTMLTVLHVMTADPVPGRSTRLFYPQIDPRDMQGYTEGDEPLKQMAWVDAMNLLHARKGVRQAAMSGGTVTIVPPQGVAQAFNADARFTTSDFFAMFGVPFADGGGWQPAEDDRRARVAVISEALAVRLYGTRQAAGRPLRIGKYDFRVVGVIGDWHPEPHFYDLTTGSYGESEQVYVPLAAAAELGFGTSGAIDCWGGASFPADGDLTRANKCSSLQFWVQLDTPAQAAAYRQFLVHYSEAQRALGRFLRPPNVRLRNVMQWLDHNDVVPRSVQMQAMLAFAFLLVCLVNTVALLLVKFLRRSGELSIRRAMGASRRAIFEQLLVEASMVGLAGGAVGLLLAWFGLWVVRQQPSQYAGLAHLDLPMLVTTFGLAVCATLMAAVFPSWRACRIVPARMLKIQ